MLVHQAPSMKVLMVAVHDSVSSQRALAWASDRAASLGAELHVVTAVPMPMPVGSPSVSAMCFPDKDLLVIAGDELQQLLIDEVLPDRAMRPEITRTVRLGDPFRVLIHETQNEQRKEIRRGDGMTMPYRSAESQ